VVRYTAEDVLADPEGISRDTVAAMKARYEELRANSRPRTGGYRR
jgi:hypothetical protein